MSFESLNLIQVQYNYPNAKIPALQGTDLKVYQGESVGLIGPSGSGKTTLVDVSLGLLKPQSGEIEYNGKALWSV